jgi:hypothetical protein
MSQNAIQDTNYNFNVTQVRLFTPAGKPSAFFGNMRDHTTDIIGFTSEKYGILQNAALMEAAEAVHGMAVHIYQKK